MNIVKKTNPNFNTHKNNRLEALKSYNVKTLKKVLTSYNKSVRKKTYKGVSKMRKSQVLKIISEEFKMENKKNNQAHQFKQKDGRFTKIFNKDK